MPRVKGGIVTRKRRKKVLKLAKGYFGSKRTLYRTAHEQVMRSLNYQYRDRRQKKREFRKLWISRINAACKLNNYKYSLLVNGLSVANVLVNRKILADIAVFDPEGFKGYIEIAKKALNKEISKSKSSKKVKTVVVEGPAEEKVKVVKKTTKKIATE